MANTTYNTASDEIDLFELFGNLWKSRLSILAFTVLGIALAALYAFTVKEEWTSKAQIIPPKSIQLGSYLEVQRGYHRFAGIEEELKVEDSLNGAYASLVTLLNAADNKRDYLQESAYFSQLTKELGGDGDEATQRRLQLMADNDLKITESNKGKQDSYNVSFIAESANNAQQTLLGYIENTNTEVLNKLFADLHTLINGRILTLENTANNIKQQAEQTRKNNILLLKQAINAAKDANITEYTGQSTAAGNTIIDFSNTESMFLLGEKYLAAQLKTMEISPVIYPVTYYQTLANINSLQQLLNVAPKGMVYEYTQKPTLPLVKDKPKKSLILILGALLGGMLGCGIVLVRAAIKQRVVKT